MFMAREMEVRCAEGNEGKPGSLNPPLSAVLLPLCPVFASGTSSSKRACHSILTRTQSRLAVATGAATRQVSVTVPSGLGVLETRTVAAVQAVRSVENCGVKVRSLVSVRRMKVMVR